LLDVLLCYIGMVKLKIDPLPLELFWAHILPPCASIIFFEIKSPKPIPITDFEVNFGFLPIPRPQQPLTEGSGTVGATR